MGRLECPHLASADELLQSGEIETVPYDYVLYCDTYATTLGIFHFTVYSIL